MAEPGSFFGAAPTERAPASMQLVVFRHKLKEVATFSTVGLSTLAGVSPKNSALEDLIGSLNDLPTAQEQIAAVEDILAESATLWPDQNVHVIARVIQDLLIPNRISLKPGAHIGVGARLLDAAMTVAPELLSDAVVNDSLAMDVLRCSANLLVSRPEFSFSPESRTRLEQAGITKALTLAENGDETPEHHAARVARQKANAIRKQIAGKIDRQIAPDELAGWVSGAASLPPQLRGRVLTLLANIFWNTMREPKNNALNDDICNMIDELPVAYRITPLEAFYNQLNLMPHEFAKTLFPIVSESINRLPANSGSARFDRTRIDLLESLRLQGEGFRTADFNPQESLADYQKRVGKRPVQPR